MTVLRFSDVRFSYDSSREVLGGASFDLLAGEIVALVGENGAGKTTITKLIAALLHPGGGVVEVCGVSTVGRVPEDFASSVGYLFQHVDQQLFAKTLMDEVAFGPLRAGKAVAEAREMAGGTLRRVGLYQQRNTHPFDLSPPHRKLVALAAAMVQEPQLYVLDEPIQGLDWGGIGLVAQTMRELAASGAAVLVVTHNMSFVAETVDRVLLVSGGKIAADESVVNVVLSDSSPCRLGLARPQAAELTIALDLPGRPIRHADIVDAIARRL